MTNNPANPTLKPDAAKTGRAQSQPRAAMSYLLDPVATLVLMQTALLLHSATRHAPTYLEPAFLASGIAHWELGRFEPFRVNPPLVRMIAALPAIAVGYQADWTKYYDSPGARSEFHLGEAFVRANGRDVIPLLHYARWACIPFSLIGAYFAYRWAKELYGSNAGLVALSLWVFEPNLLAHGGLITADVGCTSLGVLAGYSYWRWLKCPTWIRATIAGASLGVAQLSKTSWLILFGLWPLLWLLWRLLEPTTLRSASPHAKWPAGNSGEPTGNSTSNSSVAVPEPTSPYSRPGLIQLAAISLLGIYIINLGYGFDCTGTRLKDFTFVSRSLNGLQKPGQPGNRFQNTLLGLVRIPVPAQYVLGVDSQKKDFEECGCNAYLRGQWSNHGWWCYYLYGTLVKVPCGSWVLFGFVLARRLLKCHCHAPVRDELVLLVPAISLMTLVSSQTGVNTHFRYCYPALGLSLIFISQAGHAISRSSRCVSRFVFVAIIMSVGSSLCTYPNHFPYFNEFVGGPLNGHRHMLGSSLDWGQGLAEAIGWIKRHEPRSHVEFDMPSDTLARILIGHKSKGIAPGNELAASTLILYSADHYWGKESPFNTRPKRSEDAEEMVKRFGSGMVLVRVKDR